MWKKKDVVTVNERLFGPGFLFSLLFHAGIILVLVVTASFSHRTIPPPEEVIRVSISSPPAPKRAAPPPQAIEKPAPPPPQPVVEKKVVAETKVDKPKQKPKPKVEPKKEEEVRAETTEPDSSIADSQATSVTPSNSAAFGTATVDNAAFNYSWWFNQTFDKIVSNWRNTVSYDGSLVCVVYFQVLKSGRMFDLQVKSSSGIPEFDATCTLAVERSAPFPPLPRDFAEEVIGITLPFKYDPR